MYMTHTEFYDKLNNSRRTTKGEKENTVHIIHTRRDAGLFTLPVLITLT